MVGVLIVLFLIIIIHLIMLAMFFSNVIVNIDECDISYNEDYRKQLYIKSLKIGVKVYVFKIIRIANIKIYRDYLKIFMFKIKFNSLKKNIKKLNNDEKNIFEFFIKNLNKIKLLKPLIKNINLELYFGTEETILTIFSIPTLSTAISIFIGNSLEEYDSQNFTYKIIPRHMNANNFEIKCQTKFSIRTLKILTFLKEYKRFEVYNIT